MTHNYNLCTVGDYNELRSKKWFRLSNKQAEDRGLCQLFGEVILVNEVGQYVFNSYLYFTDVELENMENVDVVSSFLK
jgi:hypothetical protein